MAKPEVGYKIYVASEIYLGHGADDFLGGLCTVAATRTEMTGGKEITYVEVLERPNHWSLWEGNLEVKQAKLREEYGQRSGRICPDDRVEFNSGW